MVTLAFAVGIERCLRVGMLVQLCLKALAVIIKARTLFVGRFGARLECFEQSCSAFGSLAKMPQVSEFGSGRRVAFVVAGIRDDICLGRTSMYIDAIRVVQVFLPLDELVVAVKRTSHVVNGNFINDFCHTGKVLICIVIRVLLRCVSSVL